jgi:hypothetical protein
MNFLLLSFKSFVSLTSETIVVADARRFVDDFMIDSSIAIAAAAVIVIVVLVSKKAIIF